MLKRMRALLPGNGVRNVGSSNPARNLSCTEFEVDNWALSRFVLAKLIPVVGVEPFPLHELMLMSAAVCRLRPAMIFEWGTHVGKSARIFYETLVHYGIAGDVHSVDLPDDVEHVEHPSSHRGRLVRGVSRVHLYQGDGLDLSISLWTEHGRPSGPLFMIDGDHSYESVYRELSAIVKEVPDANVLLHDTFLQSQRSGYNIGPWRAIDEITRLNPRRFKRIDSGLGLPGMTLLYRA